MIRWCLVAVVVFGVREPRPTTGAAQHLGEQCETHVIESSCSAAGLSAETVKIATFRPPRSVEKDQLMMNMTNA
jgi:hypothetical protein